MKNTWAKYRTSGGFIFYEMRNDANTRAAVVRNYGREKELATYKRAEARGEWTRVNAVYYDTVKEAKANGIAFIEA